MIREIVFIRHTKSSWASPHLADFDRPLKKDRLADAVNMADKLKTLGLKPGLIVCSPAKRTRQTVAYFCTALNYLPEDVFYDTRIYESSAEEILQVIRETPDTIKSLVLVGHNPSLAQAANYLLPGVVSHLPTTGVIWLQLNSPDWLISSTTPTQLRYLLTPKTI